MTVEDTGSGAHENWDLYGITKRSTLDAMVLNGQINVPTIKARVIDFPHAFSYSLGGKSKDPMRNIKVTDWPSRDNMERFMVLMRLRQTACSACESWMYGGIN